MNRHSPGEVETCRIARRTSDSSEEVGASVYNKNGGLGRKSTDPTTDLFDTRGRFDVEL